MGDVEEMTTKLSKPRVAFYTLGCKLNFSETATISRDFKSDCYEHVDFNAPAEVYVINTDTESIPFPPLISPTLYFHHKKFKFPFIRQGFLPLIETKREFNKFIRIKNGESYESVFK